MLSSFVKTSAFFLASFSLSASALEIEGQWRQGHILKGKVTEGSQVEFEGRKVRVAEDGRFLLGLDRDAPDTVSLKVTSSEGNEQVTSYQVEQREYKIQRINGIKKKHMAPNKEQLDRIWKENAAIKKARQKDLARRDFEEQFKWPLLGPISGVYGSQRIFNGEPRRPHYGVDVARPTGTVVVAPVTGIVTFAHDDMYFSGGTLVVDHGHGLSSSFIHLNKILVEVGQEVAQGEPIAEVGATGRVTGPHLDWRMNWFDKRVDPTVLVPPMPKWQPESIKK
ncbi:MAG: M23 family metallopeptidase [Cellvibrionaceae bacterium]